MASQGMPIITIAKALDISAITVSNVIRQPQSQEIINQELTKRGDSITEALKIVGAEALNVLRDQMNDPDMKPEVRSGNGKFFINHLIGNPVTRIDNGPVDLESLSDEELARIVAKGREN
jgi:CTP-dependent riboflavin kinase